MSYNGEQHNNYHSGNEHRDGAPGHDSFFRGHRFSQWANRMAGDLADMRDPQPGSVTGNVYGSPPAKTLEIIHPGGAEADLGATAVAPELQNPQNAAWEQRFTTARTNIPH